VNSQSFNNGNDAGGQAWWRRPVIQGDEGANFLEAGSSRREERFLSSQADTFAGANVKKKRRLAAFEMTVGRVASDKSRSLATLGMTHARKSKSTTEEDYRFAPKASRRPSQSFSTNSRLCQGAGRGEQRDSSLRSE
jgi:hypothetical protein